MLFCYKYYTKLVTKVTVKIEFARYMLEDIIKNIVIVNTIHTVKLIAA